MLGTIAWRRYRYEAFVPAFIIGLLVFQQRPSAAIALAIVWSWTLAIIVGARFANVWAGLKSPSRLVLMPDSWTAGMIAGFLVFFLVCVYMMFPTAGRAKPLALFYVGNILLYGACKIGCHRFGCCNAPIFLRSRLSLPKYESAICIIAGLIGTVALAAGYLGLAIVITAITYIACRSFALFVRNSNNRVQLIGVEIIALLAFATVFQVF